MTGPGAVVVTGGVGYGGSHVTRGRLRAERCVVVLDDLSARRREAVGAAPLVVGAAQGHASEARSLPRGAP